ncbi:MAG: helix-turn-helix transcriptional regulator [Erysipelotrichaceae bacterium]|nr:helix-turn-helix transcriptional regulator [Erysipelotrichaceae bacterium]
MEENRKTTAKERILKAAVKVFAQKGYSATTTREIVKEAGSSLSMLDLYFGTKENLYKKVIEHVLEVYVFPSLPVFGQLVNDRKQGNTSPEHAWNQIEILTRKLLDIVTNPDNYYEIMLINRELQTKDHFVDELEPALMYIYNFQMLFEEYAQVEFGTGWARILSVQTVTGMFNLLTYQSMVKPFEEVFSYLLPEPLNDRETVEFMYQYFLSSIKGTIECYKR